MASKPLPVIDLRTAIERREIVPHFQPIVELRTGRLWGFEVLARWPHPELGVIPPERFVPLAENTGLIGSLTEMLLAQAFAAGSTFPSHLTLSTNISPLQLRNRFLPQTVRAAAELAGFSLSRLTIEITESALIGNLELALAIAEDLKALGVRLALDDFGTGYSSLQHLHALPFDEIKVDQSFVHSMTYRRESRKIAAAVVGLGHSLGLTTVGEGIENKAHADMLFYLGCELGQGWLYGKPVPQAEVPAILAAQNLAPPLGAAFLAADMAFHLEAEPAQRLAQLHAIYEGAPVGLCFLDRNLRYISENKQLSEMSHAPMGPRLGKTMGEVSPAVFEQVGPYMEGVLRGEAFSGIEVLTERPGAPGEFNTILISLQPAFDEANEVVGVSLAAVDITERKRTEQALKESEDHYRNTVELSPHIPWTADPYGKVISAGPQWEEITGLSLGETVGERWLNALHPDDRARVQANWAKALRTGSPIDIEYRIGRGDGIWRWMRARGAPRREGGEIIRWYGMLEDIDDRKRLEEALQVSEDRIRALSERNPCKDDVAAE